MNFFAKNKSLKGIWYLWLPFGLGIIIGGVTGTRVPKIEGLEMEAMQVQQPFNTNCSQTSITGTVLRKPWAKTAESWMAGGGDYYVLDVGDAEIEERSALEGVILRPSDRLSLETFDRYLGRRVEVKGEYVQAKPYIPQNPMESYPMDIDGNPLPTGAGFQVCEIEIVP